MFNNAVKLVFAFILSVYLGCAGASITNRPVAPQSNEISITQYSCNVEVARKSINENFSDANVIAEALSYHVMESNLFRNVGVLNKDANLTLKATILSSTQPGFSFGSFPVDLKINYQLTGKDVNWEKEINTKTDSKLGCTDIFMAGVRHAHDTNLAFTKNFSNAIIEMQNYFNSLKTLKQGKK